MSTFIPTAFGFMEVIKTRCTQSCLFALQLKIIKQQLYMNLVFIEKLGKFYNSKSNVLKQESCSYNSSSLNLSNQKQTEEPQ